MQQDFLPLCFLRYPIFVYLSSCPTAYILATEAESYVIENFDEIAPSTIGYCKEDGDPVWLTRRVYEYYMGGPRLEPADDFVKVKDHLSCDKGDRPMQT